MEENENISLNEDPVMVLDEQAKTYLGISAKWSKMIAIIMFISIAFLIIMGIAAFSLNGMVSQLGNEMEGMDPEIRNGMDFGYLHYLSGFISFIYIAIGLIMLYPTLKLYHFSEKTQTALRRNDSEVLKSALENHKSYFKFTGIMYLVMIGFSIFMTIGTFIFAFSRLNLPSN
ncbi:MAG: hypothetical protein IPH57_15785 [Saprospiraceae bacterium]|nr:hypothetical protein [Saprospiraceae bacterium]